MKQFFEEYGGVIIILIVVAVLLLILGNGSITNDGLAKTVYEAITGNRYTYRIPRIFRWSRSWSWSRSLI